ncbi:MAG: DUF4294 domain-containing protein [Saprospiraceae bacterium]|nr:DUF4294 domain-containing protein [Saprospiraceae bacterium]
MKYLIIFISFISSSSFLLGQDTLLLRRDTIEIPIPDHPETVEPVFTELLLKGQVYSAMISDGDTLILADLDDISITSLRKFDSDADYRKYLKFRRYAAKVFPYAKEAIRIFREVEYASEHLSKRERKKKIKQLEKELKAEFEEPLKKLTKLQGKIMIKMIEKETGHSMYNLMKSLKGRFTAFYWNQFSKLYSYNLKEGYQEGKYEILDAVLKDFDLSYRIENGTNMKYIKIDDIRKNN